MEDPIVKKILPHSYEAEQAVIGSMIMDPDAVPIAMELINKDDFFNRQYGLLFGAMTELYREGKNGDLVTIKAKLEEMDVSSEVISLDFIREILEMVPTSANIKQYATIVYEKAMLRKLIKVNDNISAKCYAGTDKLEDIMESTEKEVFEVLRSRSSGDFVPINKVVANVFDKLEQASLTKGTVTGLATGYIYLDNQLSGLQPSDFILIAARPSVGKTAFALNIAQYAAVEKGVPTAIFSLEMSAGQLMNRLLSVQSRIEAGKFRSAGLTSDEYERLAYAAGKIADSPLFIDDTSGITPTELKARCEKLKNDKTKGLGLIVIDYLQLMNGGTGRKTDSVQQEVAYISKSLKGIARDLNVPVIALSQLSRAVESRSDKRPMLSDLRESGAIEQDADVVCFLYREQYYKPDTIDKKNQAEVIIAKQRNGPLGTVNLAWLGQYTKFENLEINEYDIDVSDLDDIENQ